MSNLSALMAGLAARRFDGATSPRLLLSIFAATLFASALMLFSVQPMFARMALPLLGGAPAVWAVSMCFFQAALLAGYCYAHALNRWLTPQRAVIAHLALLALTQLVLPIALPQALSEPPEGDAYLWLLGVLTLGVGLPFFAVSATAPLLQSWFARTGHPDAGDPYFLYGASNAGSLIALIAYPFIVEPALGLSAQSAVWSAGFALLAAMIAVCGGLMLLGRDEPQFTWPRIEARTAPSAATVPGLKDRLAWLALAALPSGLMTAVTTYITTDIASAPFIWVAPLSLYLLTFILVFRGTPLIPHGASQVLMPFAILALILFPTHGFAALVAILAFFLAALVCHRELYIRRPDAGHLTQFYIWMSAGGVIGGIFSALVAPHIFATVFEFKLLLLLALLARRGVLLDVAEPLRPLRVAAGVVLLSAAFAAYKLAVEAGFVSHGGFALYALIALTLAALAVTRRWPEHRALLVLAMIVGVAIMPGDSLTLHTQRSFFGTLRVMMNESGTHHLMLHGTTVHGAERFKTNAGNPVAYSAPATYYHYLQPMPQGVAAARSATRASGRPFSVGVVGLGAGSLSCYAEPGDSWRFYEIDPMVASVARDPAYFSYLSRCMGDGKIVFGDARLTLKKEPQGAFDYLVLDAFSSDAIPVHLLTSEALVSYLDHLSPRGLIAIHISNRFLDLVPAISATVATLPGVAGFHVNPPAATAEPDATRSHVLFLARDPATLAAARLPWKDARPLDPEGVAAWTDDYADVLTALVRGLRQ